MSTPRPIEYISVTSPLLIPGKWVSVGDVLPEMGERSSLWNGTLKQSAEVLVASDKGVIIADLWCRRPSVDSSWEGPYWGVPNVTHWMPLPLEPEGHP